MFFTKVVTVHISPKFSDLCYDVRGALLCRFCAGHPDPSATAQEEASPPGPAQGGRRRQEASADAQAAGEAAGPADAVPTPAGRWVADVHADRGADGVVGGRAGWRRVLQHLGQGRGGGTVGKKRRAGQGQNQ
jgi:hypothetical protein